MADARDCIAPLFVPADRPERFAKAAASGADAVILDLEDAVAAPAKAAARANLRADLGVPVIVRVNGVGTSWWEADLLAARDLPLAGLLIPKSELSTLGDVASAPGGIPILALIETARGLADARAVAALPGVARLVFGSVDFSADLGLAHEREPLLLARSEIVLASRLAGLAAPLDGVTTYLEAADAADDARYGRALGFGGKLCIHPRQIAAVLAGFRPSEAEAAWARRVLASGDGAVALDGAMVDEPVRARARAILSRLGEGAGRDPSGAASRDGARSPASG